MINIKIILEFQEFYHMLFQLSFIIIFFFIIS